MKEYIIIILELISAAADQHTELRFVASKFGHIRINLDYIWINISSLIHFTELL